MKMVSKSDALAQIVCFLGEEPPFIEVTDRILKSMQEYVGNSDAIVMQISSGMKVLSIVNRISTDEKRASEQVKLDSGEFVAQDGQVCVIDCDSADEKAVRLLEKLGLKSCVIVPVIVNDMRAMYVIAGDAYRTDIFDEEKVQFVETVSKVIQSIAQKKSTKNSLLASYEVLKEILSNIGSGIMVFDKVDKNVLFENDIAKNTQDVRRIILNAMLRYQELMDEKPDCEDAAKPVESYDSESGLWFEVKFSDMVWIDGSRVMVCTAVDITQRKKNQQRIEYQANNDFLTGLYNRMKCENDLRFIIKDAVSKGQKGAVAFLDLDDFKHINDGLGHQYGDVLLQQIAAGLQSVPGLRGHCYRMGGDEFVVVVEPEQFPELQKIIKNVLAMFNKPWYLMGTEYFCTMSMGISIFPDNSTDVHEITKMADMAMYDAKKSGKNRYGFYDGSKSRNTIKRLDIENNMRQAVASEIQEFIVFYQPVVDAKTKECVSCEALVRWNSKALGFVGPGDFIPLAEYLGLITDIGDYVLEEACKQCKFWNDNGYPHFHVNVNLSVVQLLQKNVVENIGMILNKTGVDPRNIVLEITESFAINDMDRVMKIIAGLKALGPRIALDDFGTGYSSLNYIKQLPLNIIKVDKTFIDDIVEDEYAQAFVKLIVDLSKTIDTKIVVEGIESKEQFELLKDIGVNYIQGYLFGKPVAADEFTQKYLGKKL